MTSSPSTLRRLLTLCLCGILAAPALAQTLARPGWAGSGITTDLWWKHAIFYQVNPANFSPSPSESPLHSLAQRLDYIHTLGVDAILLTPIQPDPAHATSVKPTLGTLDDFDDLLREASRRDLRILLDLDPAIPPGDLANVARFWLNHGIAGFHLIGAGNTAHAQAEALRAITNTYLGQRILIADADATLPSDPRQRTYKAPNTQRSQLLLNASLAHQDKLTASAFRPILDATQDTFDAGRGLPLLATDGPGFSRSFTRFSDGHHDAAIAKVLATVLLAAHAESLLYYGQELGIPTPEPTPLITWTVPTSTVPPAPARRKAAPSPPTGTPNPVSEDADPDSLLNWYRQLTALHHRNATIATGSSITLDRDDKNVLVWVRKPQSITSLNPPLVVICNLTGAPVTLSLKADLTHLHLRGSFLRTVLRSDHGMGTMHLDSMTIAPYAAYIGQLRF
jgi:glycosidase